MIFLFEEFIDSLNEGRDADLYHWIGLEKFYDLVENDIIYAKWRHIIDGKKVLGNSLSRNKNLNYSYPIRITFDQSKLSNNHKIIPIDGEKVFHVNDEGSDYSKRDRTPNKFGIKNYNESPFKNFNQTILAEEFCLGDMKNVHKYILKIEIFGARGFQDDLTDKGITALKKYCDKYKIEFSLEKRKNII